MFIYHLVTLVQYEWSCGSLSGGQAVTLMKIHLEVTNRCHPSQFPVGQIGVFGRPILTHGPYV